MIYDTVQLTDAFLVGTAMCRSYQAVLKGRGLDSRAVEGTLMSRGLHHPGKASGKG